MFTVLFPPSVTELSSIHTLVMHNQPSAQSQVSKKCAENPDVTGLSWSGVGMKDFDPCHSHAARVPWVTL